MAPEQVYAHHKNGRLVPVAITASPIFDEQRETVGAVEVFRDVSKEMELLQRIQAASQAKSDFLAGMSHELRTPLNAIIGFSEVLHDRYFGALNEKQAEYVTDIHGSGKHLLSLINDVLDLSKIEAGKMELELSRVKIRDLLENSLVMIKERSYKHGLRLDLQIPAELSDLEITADERKLKQIMFNLLSNAAKFTPAHGSIKVAVRIVDCRLNIENLEKRPDCEQLLITNNQSSIVNIQCVEISITDTGIGIASEDQERIFGEFFQVKGGLTDKTPGTGLGLPLTRHLVELHGGKIRVESMGQGKGSRFSFVLPLKIEGGPR